MRTPLDAARKFAAAPGTARRAALALPAALAVALYANTLANGFAYDDVGVIQQDTTLHGLRHVPEIFRRPYWPERYGGAKTALYRPVTSTAFALQWTLWDGRPRGFHLGNVALHALVSALVAALLLRCGAGPGGAALGGALFAAHPVHTEAVANVVGQAELLAATFALAALLVALGPRRDAPLPAPAAPGDRAGSDPGAGARAGGSGGQGRAGRAAASALLYLGAALSKESAMVLPALLVLLDGVRGAWRPSLRAASLGPYLRNRGPLLAAWATAAVAALAARWAALGTPVGHDVPGALIHLRDDPAARLFTMVRVWPHYVRLLVAPLDLSADYSPAVILPARELTPMGALGLGLAALWGATLVATSSRAPLVAAGIGWAAAALLPVSNLLVLSGVLLAERTLYLPSVGLSLAIAGLWGAGRRRARRALAFACAAWTAGAAAIVVPRNRVWTDSTTVFESILRDHPESYKGHWVMANTLAERGEWSAAFDHYLEAARIWPHDPRLWAEIAGRFLQRDQPEMAARAAERAVALGPGDAPPHRLLAVSRLRLRQWEAAAEAARRGLEAAGPDPTLHYVRAAALEQLGHYAHAARELEASARLDPGAWQPWFQAAGLHARAGEFDEARAALDSARHYAAGDTAALGQIERYRASLPAAGEPRPNPQTPGPAAGPRQGAAEPPRSGPRPARGRPDAPGIR